MKKKYVFFKANEESSRTIKKMLKLDCPHHHTTELCGLLLTLFIDSSLLAGHRLFHYCQVSDP